MEEKELNALNCYGDGKYEGLQMKEHICLGVLVLCELVHVCDCEGAVLLCTLGGRVVHLLLYFFFPTKVQTWLPRLLRPV